MQDEHLAERILRLVEEREVRALRDELIELPPPEIAELIIKIPEGERAIIFRILPKDIASEVFSEIEPEDQEQLLGELGNERVAVLLNEMSADDRTAFFEEIPAAAVRQLLLLLSKEERAIASSLLGYPESSVGRLMTPDYITVKEDWKVQDVLDYVRKHGKDSDSLNIVYVVDDKGKLIDDIRMREILLSPQDRKIQEMMNFKATSLQATQDQEEAVEIFKKYGRSMLPVVDSQGVMLGIVTIDDVLEVAEEEATEDIQKIGGVEALDDPYIKTPTLLMIKKRVGWLIVLFLGEMLTASAMAFYEDQIARAVVLALFVPLIISSGGNSGSQAATLIIRALAIGEIELKDWGRVLKREILTGLSLGAALGAIGFMRIALWEQFVDLYGPHWPLVGLTVFLALVFVVLWGTVTGSMLPFILKSLRLDPATSSAPFVATIVDVTGLVAYFTIASVILAGIIL